MTSLNISLTKSQAEFLELKCYYPGFFGGLGSGKSYVMGLRAVLDAHHSPSVKIGVYEPSHELLRQVAIPAVEYWLNEFGIKYTHNKNDHIITTHADHVGNFIFKSLDNIDLLIGYETYAAHVDELDTLNTDKARAAWDKIVSRNRQNPDDLPKDKMEWSEKNKRWEAINRTCAYSSPEGFKFCYERWKRSDNPAYQCVHGRTADNPAVTQAYIEERTKTLSPEHVKAYLNGEFVNLTSGTVYSSYDRFSCDSLETIIGNEPLYIGMDFNIRQMAAAIFVRRKGGLEWHCVRELIGLQDTFTMIQAIKANWPNNKIIVYPDASGKNNSSNARLSNIALLEDAGFEVRARKKNPNVVDRVEAVNKGFRDKRIFVNQTVCSEIARCLEQQTYDKNGEPDKTSGNDHPNDAFGYAMDFEMPLRNSIIPIEFRWMTKGSLHAR